MAKVERCLTGVASTARKDDLADVDTSDGAVWLAPSTTHTGLETVFPRSTVSDNEDELEQNVDAPIGSST